MATDERKMMARRLALTSYLTQVECERILEALDGNEQLAENIIKIATATNLSPLWIARQVSELAAATRL